MLVQYRGTGIIIPKAATKNKCEYNIFSWIYISIHPEIISHADQSALRRSCMIEPHILYSFWSMWKRTKWFHQNDASQLMSTLSHTSIRKEIQSSGSDSNKSDGSCGQMTLSKRRKIAQPRRSNVSRNLFSKSVEGQIIRRFTYVANTWLSAFSSVEMR